MLFVDDDQDRAARRAELNAEFANTIAKREKDKKNKDFTQVYPAGWQRLRDLIGLKPNAAKVYTFLAEHCDWDGASVICSQEVMSEMLGISVRTVVRLTQFLEEQGAIVRIRAGKGVYAYALDPSEVWKSTANAKEFASFYTKALVSMKDPENLHVARRVKTFVSKPPKSESKA